MKIAAVHAIADLAKEPVPDVVNKVYNVNNLTFGPDYFIPKPVDPRLITEVSAAVAKAAMDSGVARKQITDWAEYKKNLRLRMGQETRVTQNLFETARKHPQKVVFAEGLHPTMIKAAVQAKNEGLCYPILLGNTEMIRKEAEKLDLSLDGIEIVNLRHDDAHETRERYARVLAEKRKREGYNFEEANDKMFDRNYFGMMMVETGDADALITGVYTKFSSTLQAAEDIIGIRPQYKHFATMHILNSKRGTYYIADTLVNRHPDKDAIKDIARLTADTIRFFNDEPRIAMISYSNFGADKVGSPRMISDVVREMQEEYPDLKIDGEMSVDLALDHERRDEKYPFLRLHNQVVNSMVFPNLSSANSAYKLIKQFSQETEVIGPIQMGLNKPIHFTDFDAGVRDIVNITAVAVIDAYVGKLSKK